MLSFLSKPNHCKSTCVKQRGLVETNGSDQDTARTAPAAPTRQADQNSDEQAAWHLAEQTNEAGERRGDDGFNNDRKFGGTGVKSSASASHAWKTRSVGGSGGRRRRDATNAIRRPGHDQRKPYSSFHRFEKVIVGIG